MKELKTLFFVFGLVVGLAVLLAEFFAYETRTDYGWQPPPSPESRRAVTGEADEGLRSVAPELFEDK